MRSTFCRKTKTKGGTFSNLTFYRYRSAVQFHQLFDDGEPQPQALHADFRDPVGLIEGLKEIGLGFTGNAGAGIGDGQEDVTWRSRSGFHSNASIFRSKFMGIVDEIGYDLVEAIRITPDRQVFSCDFDRQVLSLGLCQWQQFLCDVLEQFRKGNGLAS